MRFPVNSGSVSRETARLLPGRAQPGDGVFTVPRSSSRVKDADLLPISGGRRGASNAASVRQSSRTDFDVLSTLEGFDNSRLARTTTILCHKGFLSGFRITMKIAMIGTGYVGLV